MFFVSLRHHDYPSHARAHRLIRNVRRDSNEDLKKQEKNGEITEDDLRNQTEEVQNITNDFIKQIDDLTTQKENDILEV